MKVKLSDKQVLATFWFFSSIFFAIVSIISVVTDALKEYNHITIPTIIITLIIFYLICLLTSEFKKEVHIDIDGSNLIIKCGDIFKENGFKVIPFNEYFDTIVDGKIISEKSLNGIFIKKIIKTEVDQLDSYIDSYDFDNNSEVEKNNNRKTGKKRKFKIGTICVSKDYLLAAFSKFDENNKAILTMPEYLEFLIDFWDNVNRVYGQESVNVPIFGSGITRIKGHKNISDEDLLRIMIWTFRISEMRFKYPANLRIIVHHEKIKKINLSAIKYSLNGLGL